MGVDVVSLAESLAALPVVGVAYYPDPELRHTHVPSGPTWWYVAEDYAVRVDLSRTLSAADEALAANIIEGIA